MTWIFFDTTRKGSGARATVQWLAEHQEASRAPTLKKLLAEAVLGFWVWERSAEQWGLSLLVQEGRLREIREHAALIEKLLAEGYLAQLDRKLTMFTIEIPSACRP